MLANYKAITTAWFVSKAILENNLSRVACSLSYDANICFGETKQRNCVVHSPEQVKPSSRSQTTRSIALSLERTKGPRSKGILVLVYQLSFKRQRAGKERRRTGLVKGPENVLCGTSRLFFTTPKSFPQHISSCRSVAICNPFVRPRCSEQRITGVGNKLLRARRRFLCLWTALLSQNCPCLRLTVVGRQFLLFVVTLQASRERMPCPNALRTGFRGKTSACTAMLDCWESGKVEAASSGATKPGVESGDGMEYPTAWTITLIFIGQAFTYLNRYRWRARRHGNDSNLPVYFSYFSHHMKMMDMTFSPVW